MYGEHRTESPHRHRSLLFLPKRLGEWGNVPVADRDFINVCIWKVRGLGIIVSILLIRDSVPSLPRRDGRWRGGNR